MIGNATQSLILIDECEHSSYIKNLIKSNVKTITQKKNERNLLHRFPYSFVYYHELLFEDKVTK